jgi:hypothetical protein
MRSPLALLTLLSLSLASCGKVAEDERATTATGSASSAVAPATQAPPAQARVDTLTITFAVLAAGTTREDRSTEATAFKITMDGGARGPVEVDQSETKSKVTRTEILATDGKAVTRARVTYVSEKKTVLKNGEEQTQPANPTTGKTYSLELKGGKLLITDEQGKRVPKGEDAAVRRSNPRFGQPDPVAAALPDKPLGVGDKVDALASAFEGFVKDRDDGKDGKNPMAVSGVEVKLASVEQPGPDAVGVFSIALTMGSPKDNKEVLGMQAPLEGTMRVRARDGRVLSVALAGPITIASTNPKFKMSGSGDVKLGTETTY